jgi:hypothetical protein
MEDYKIIQSVVDSLTGKMTYEFTVPIRVVQPVKQPKRAFWDWVRRKPKPDAVEPERERSFKIYQCIVANQYRIAAKALSLPVDLYENDEEDRMLSYVPEHLPTMIYIIAAAVQNNHLEPDPELIQFFERNLDNTDIEQLLAASLQATNMQSFLISIVYMNGMANILKPKASPQDGSE